MYELYRERKNEMSNFKKLIFYYEPGNINSGKYTRSFTLSFSRLDNDCNTYKQKAILEYFSNQTGKVEECKMKEVHIGTDKIMEKINKIDFEKEYSSPRENDEKIFISFGDYKIETSDIDKLHDVIADFNVFGIMNIHPNHYKFVKDMNEYTALLNAMYTKLPELDSSEQKFMLNYFINNDPYKCFQNIPYLKSYIDFLQSKEMGGKH